jgi:hypothetical protein
MGGSNSKTTVNYLISLIDRVHKIYNDTVWRDTLESGGFSGMGFIIKKIVVHRKPTQTRENEVHYNMFRSSWDVRNLLEVFSREYTHKAVLRIRIHMFLGLLDPDPVVGSMDPDPALDPVPDPSIIKQI